MTDLDSILKNRYHFAKKESPYSQSYGFSSSHLLLGARVRNSARGKGHEEGGSTYTKAGSSLRSPPGNSRASTPPQNQSLPTLLLCALTYTYSDFTGGCPPPALSEKELT